MKKLFLFFLFLSFALPKAYILPIGFALEFRELGLLLLPFLNALIKPENKLIYHFSFLKRIRNAIYLFFGVVLFTEFFLKFLIYDQSLADSIKSLRMGLPLFCGLILILQGLRIDVNRAIKALMLAIACSVVLSLVNVFYQIPLQTTLRDVESTNVFNGRLGNLNFSFGLIGLYLLMEKSGVLVFRTKIVRNAAFLSLFSLIGAFNRTYLALMAVEFVVLFFKRFSLKNAVKVSLVSAVFVFGVVYAYSSSEIIQNQINKRFLSIVEGSVTVESAVIEDNRDFIYDGIEQRILEGYWLLGMPYSMPIFTIEKKYNIDEVSRNKTDISLVNILLRFGVVPFFLYLLIFVRMRNVKIRAVNFVFFFYFLASFNIDSLFNHNSIFFVLFLFLVISYSSLKGVQVVRQ